MLNPEMPELSSNPEDSTPTRRRSRGWILLLTLPYAALCFPQLYMRATPTLWGFPFFYWYQFAWVLITSGILGFFYWLGNRPAVNSSR